MTSFVCDQKTELSDSEIAEIIRGVAVNGVAGPFNLVDTAVDCALADRHIGDCAGLVGILDGKSGQAWLRWGDGRRVDWLADCAKGNCELYRGHPGECNPDIFAGNP